MADQTYLITARKYRPLLFHEVVAQEHVTETLKNAIRLDRLAHAYMFSGPRGVGKTTAARILAKAINCLAPLDDRKDRSEPCRSCESCLSFEEGRNLNIIEIDAASNNKVDDARDLRETVRIPPQGGRMKVYIIDEVHMLTTSAFNALLKTLEEPPPYALFIFATTEPNKVLPTIQSRCQRFDFRRIAIPEIISRLKEICDTEEITADESALMLIARKGDGALRDALSVFDQAISLCGTSLVYEDIVKALGIVNTDLYFDVTDATATSDAARMIRLVEQIVRSGYDLQEFLDGLAEHLRNLLVVKTVGDRALIEATEKMQDRYEAESQRFSESVLLRLVHIVGETADLLRNTRQPRLRLEMSLLKMTRLPSALDMRAAFDKLDRLEQLASRFPSGPTVKEEPSAEVPGIVPASTDLQAEQKTEEPETSTPIVPSESGVQKEQEVAGENVAPAETVHSTAATPTVAPSPVAPPPTAPSPREEQSVTVERETETLRLPFDTPAIKRTPPKSQDVTLTVNPSDAGTQNVPSAVLELEDESSDLLVRAWECVVTETMENQIRLGSLLRHTKVLQLVGAQIQIGVPDAFHERALRGEKQHLLQSLALKVEGDITDIHFVVSEELQALLGDPHNDQFDARAALKMKCEENPAVQLLVERFGGEIVW